MIVCTEREKKMRVCETKKKGECIITELTDI